MFVCVFSLQQTPIGGLLLSFFPFKLLRALGNGATTRAKMKRGETLWHPLIRIGLYAGTQHLPLLTKLYYLQKIKIKCYLLRVSTIYY